MGLFNAILGNASSIDIEDVVEAHCNTFRLAQQLFFAELIE